MRSPIGPRSYKSAILAAFVAAPALVASSLAWAAPPAAPAGAVVMIDGARATAAGRPLYVYDRDTKDSSACTGQCTASWSPVLAADGAAASGDWTLISRADGGRQWVHKGRPVYVFFRDAPGQAATGDNKIPGWHALK